MKKVLSVILILCTLVGLLVPAASAADTLTDLQRAVVETALTYYYKGNSVQYDSYYLTNGNRDYSALLRQTNNTSPEDSSVDNVHYSVCSAFPHDTYFNAFGVHVIDAVRNEAIERYGSVLEPYLENTGLSGAALDYGQALLGVTENYCLLGRLWYETGENVGNMVVAYWGPERNADGAVVSGEFAGRYIDSTGKTVEVDFADVKEDSTKMQAFSDALQATAQPGDIIAAFTKTSDGGRSGGHTMMFLGDVLKTNWKGNEGTDYIIHCNGSKYNNNDADSSSYDTSGNLLQGFDLLEDGGNSAGSRNGAIYVTNYVNLCGAGKSWFAGNSYEYALLRPLNMLTANNLTDNAKFRLHHPAMAITKTASVKPYNDVKIGDEITYTVKLENNTLDTYGAAGNLGLEDGVTSNTYHGAVYAKSRNKTYSDLVLEETVPAGTTLVSASGAKVDGNKLTWNVASMKPAAVTELSYTVKVTGDITGTRGKLYATSNTEGFLNTPAIDHEVVGTKMAANAFSTITSSSVTSSVTAVRSGTDVAEDVYAALGYKLELPHAEELLQKITYKMATPLDGGTLNKIRLHLADVEDLSGEAAVLRNMVVPGFVAGKRLLTTDENGVRTNKNRLRQLNNDFLQPGDILVYAKAGDDTTGSVEVTGEKAYVYLGSDKFAYYEGGKFTVLSDPEVFYSAKSDGSSVSKIESDLGKYDSNSTKNQKYSYSKVLHQALLQDFVVCLRPSRVGLATRTAQTNAGAVELIHEGVSTNYTTLSAAYKAAVNGDTLKLGADITVTSTNFFASGTNVTIDLNGHTVYNESTDPASGHTLKFLGSGAHTLKNGTVYGAIYAGNTASLHLENMTVIGRNVEASDDNKFWYGTALGKAGAPVVTLKNVTLATDYDGSAIAGYSPLQISNSSKLDCVNYGNLTFMDDVTLLIPVASASETVDWNYSKITQSNGMQVYTSKGVRSLDGKVSPTAGDMFKAVTFTTQPAVTNVTTGKNYASMSDAMAESVNGNELRLDRDVNTADAKEYSAGYKTDATAVASYFYTCSKDLTIDLNGKTLTDTVSASGTFYLRDNGKEEGLSKVVLKNGKMYSVSPCFNTGSILELDNMNIESEKAVLFMSQSGDANQEVLVNGGRLVSGVGNSGVSAGVAEVRQGTMTLTGNAVLIGLARYAANVGIDAMSGKVVVESAVLAATPYAYNVNNAAHVLVNANSSVEIAEGSRKASGRMPVTEVIDGVSYTLLADVYDNKGEVKIGDEEYATLEEAFEAAEAGDKLEMQESISVEEALTVPADVELAIGDTTMTLAEGVTMTVAGKVTVGEEGKIEAEKTQIVLAETGDYMGITFPAGITETVHPDAELSETEVNVESAGALKLSAEGVDLYDVKTGSNVGRILAKQIAQVFTVAPMVRDGEAVFVGKTREISVKSVAEEKLEATEWEDEAQAAEGRSLVAMLNYGMEATKLLTGENVENTYLNTYKNQMSALTSQLTEVRKDNTLLKGSDLSVIYGATGVMEDELKIRFYFRVEEGKYNDFRVKVAYGDTELMLTPAELEEAGGAGGVKFYRYTVADLNQKDYAEAITVTAVECTTTTTGEGEEAVTTTTEKMLATVTDTIAAYAARLYSANGGQRAAMADAMILYGMAAKAMGK